MHIHVYESIQVSLMLLSYTHLHGYQSTHMHIDKYFYISMNIHFSVTILCLNGILTVSVALITKCWWLASKCISKAYIHKHLKLLSHIPDGQFVTITWMYSWKIMLTWYLSWGLCCCVLPSSKIGTTTHPFSSLS